MDDPGLAARLRAATAEQHRRAEGSPFVEHLMAGRLGAGAYADLAGQLWFVYRALEQPFQALLDDAVVGPLLDRALLRLPRLEADLAVLRGRRWREGVAPFGATRRTAERITALARDWPPGYLAHHYTRYLGDLSGGRLMQRSLSRHYGLPHDALSFFVFPGIQNTKPFKDEYRRRLDATPLSEQDRKRVANEARNAFELATDLFAELHELHRPGAERQGLPYLQG